MINSIYLNFIYKYQDFYHDKVQFVIKDYYGRYLKAQNYVFKVINIKNFELYKLSDIIIMDGNGRQYTIRNYIDRFIDIGKNIIIPSAFATSPQSGFIELHTPIGYTLGRDDLELSTTFKLNELVDNNKVILLKDRGGFILNSRYGLPDDFWKDFPQLSYLKLDEDNIQNYLNSIKLVDYDGTYSLSELENPILKSNQNINKKEQDFDSRQSKIHILNKHTHKYITRTTALLANHKMKQFGMDASEFRKLENQKIFDLLENDGINKDDICLARKEVKGIRARIPSKEDNNKFVIVKARFVEIDFETHQDINNKRYLQDGSIIELKDDKWWFVNEL